MQAVQIIDQTKAFHADSLAGLLEGCASGALRVVAILGPQSSGKSTLLNGVFGTSFQVMDESQRKQTTLGVWACRTAASNIVVLDVEGTDGRERGEDQDFERKSALFSLATAHVLIVNIWENAVGLYHGANMSLLRTVMDVHRQLVDPSASSSCDTVLLFVVRDYAGKTPQANIADVLVQDLRRIWSALRKDDAAADTPLEDAFAVRFAFLPHKILQSDDFDEQMRLVKDRFFNESNPEYIFPAVPDDEQLVPEDFAPFAAGIWARVDSNKDLDLPTERELLAQYRCDEIAKSIVQAFDEHARRLRETLMLGQLVASLGTQLCLLLHEAKASFADQTVRYAKNVSSRKLAELASRLLATMHDLSRRQAQNAADLALCALQKSMEAGGGGTGDFMVRLRDGEQRALQLFEESLLDCQVEELAAQWDSDKGAFQESLQEACNSLKAKEASCRFAALQKKVTRTLHALQSPSFGMQDEKGLCGSLWRLLQECHEQAEDFVDTCHTDLDLPGAETTSLLEAVQRWLEEEVRTVVADELSDQRIADRVAARFECDFAYDDSQLPRIWSNEEEVNTEFKRSSQGAFAELDSIRASAVPDWVATSPLATVFPEAEMNLVDERAYVRIKRSLEKQFERRFIEAKRSTIASQSHIPPWVFLLLLVLGWNEIMTILSSPLYFLIFLLCATGLTLLRVFNLTPYLSLASRHFMRRVRQVLPEPRVKVE